LRRWHDRWLDNIHRSLDAGFYDFRLNDSDNGGIEIDFLTFEVRE
jgi:hypothetical protein